MNIDKIIKETVLTQKTYQIDERTCPIKLDANESPYSLDHDVCQAIAERFKKLSLNRYPSPGSPELRKKFANYYGVNPDMIIIGNGSDELIQLLVSAVRTASHSSVMIPSPTFAMYKIAASNAGHNVIEIPLNDNFDLEMKTLMDVVVRDQPRLIFLSYPNNPTGKCFSRNKIEEILDISEGIVVVDEAYCNYSGKTFLPDLAFRKNLVILRTLSKIGLAGSRFGILLGHPPLINELNKVRSPYNLNAFAQIIGEIFIDYKEMFLRHISELLEGRAFLFKGLKAIEGIEPYPTEANFILFNCFAEKNIIYEGLIDEGVLIKSFTAPDILTSCMRVTVGTDSENKSFLRLLEKRMRDYTKDLRE